LRYNSKCRIRLGKKGERRRGGGREVRRGEVHKGNKEGGGKKIEKKYRKYKENITK
jgi:hypothetical protein